MWQHQRKTGLGKDLFIFLNCTCIHNVCIFVPRWINENFVVFFLFTGCDEYLNAHPILSFQTNQPVDLRKASSVSLSATQATSCTFNQTDSVHDYSGFRSRWTTISNGFFNLTMTSGNGKFNLSVRAADCQWLSWVKLSKLASCMAKIAPTWLVTNQVGAIFAILLGISLRMAFFKENIPRLHGHLLWQPSHLPQKPFLTTLTKCSLIPIILFHAIFSNACIKVIRMCYLFCVVTCKQSSVFRVTHVFKGFGWL